jgi:hypothetical protein
MIRVAKPLPIMVVCIIVAFAVLATAAFAKKHKTAAPIPTGKNATFTLDSMTFYGWFDNSPPGCGIAHPVIHTAKGGCAGGVGTFEDPITFAVAPEVQNNVPPGEIIYIPSLQKYFIMEDDCTGSGPGGVAVQGQGCDGELEDGINEFDLWIDGAPAGTPDNPGAGPGNTDNNMTNCEDTLTASKVEVIMNATNGQPVNTAPLLNNGVCIKK